MSTAKLIMATTLFNEGDDHNNKRRQSPSVEVEVHNCGIGGNRGLISTKPINAKAAAVGHALLKRRSDNKPAYRPASKQPPQLPPSFNLDPSSRSKPDFISFSSNVRSANADTKTIGNEFMSDTVDSDHTSIRRVSSENLESSSVLKSSTSQHDNGINNNNNKPPRRNNSSLSSISFTDYYLKKNSTTDIILKSRKENMNGMAKMNEEFQELVCIER